MKQPSRTSMTTSALGWAVGGAGQSFPCAPTVWPAPRRPLGDNVEGESNG